MSQTAREFPQGITVKELKEILAHWPETNGRGEPTRVWIESSTNLMESVVREVTSGQVDLTDPQTAADVYLRF
jgi:hypothetical protein